MRSRLRHLDRHDHLDNHVYEALLPGVGAATALCLMLASILFVI